MAGADVVMLVEDDPSLRFVFTHLLKLRGFEVVALSNGEEALDYTKKNSAPKMIFLDLTLPGMGGVEYRRKQLADPALAKVPTVLTSGRDDLRAWAAKLGTQGYLRKPYSIDELYGTLDKISPAPSVPAEHKVSV